MDIAAAMGDWEGLDLVLSAPASAPRSMPPDAQSFVIGGAIRATH